MFWATAKSRLFSTSWQTCSNDRANNGLCSGHVRNTNGVFVPCAVPLRVLIGRERCRKRLKLVGKHISPEMFR